jgi:hypothetical protein
MRGPLYSEPHVQEKGNFQDRPDGKNLRISTQGCINCKYQDIRWRPLWDTLSICFLNWKHTSRHPRRLVAGFYLSLLSSLPVGSRDPACCRHTRGFRRVSIRRKDSLDSREQPSGMTAMGRDSREHLPETDLSGYLPQIAGMTPEVL